MKFGWRINYSLNTGRKIPFSLKYGGIFFFSLNSGRRIHFVLKFRKIIQYFIENWKENSFLMKSWRRTHILLKSGSRIQFSLKSRRRIKLCNIISEIFPLARSKLFVCMTVTLFLKPKKKNILMGNFEKALPMRIRIQIFLNLTTYSSLVLV